MKKYLMVMMMLTAGGVMASDIEIKVNGMVCSMCAQGIEKKFSSEESVQKIDVNLDHKMVHLQTKNGQNIPDSTIKKLITEAGYQVVSIKRE